MSMVLGWGVVLPLCIAYLLCVNIVIGCGCVLYIFIACAGVYGWRKA